MDRREELRNNVAKIKKLIDDTAAESSRKPGEVTLLPVTKFHPRSDIEHLAALGVHEVGENREQEARDKATLPGIHVHMIGQIQTKKSNSVARWASVVQSVDSVKLARALDRGMARALDTDTRLSGLPQRLECFVQWSADGDESRGGVAIAGLDQVVAELMEAEHLRFAGVMCVPPLGSQPEDVFSRARSLTDTLEEKTGQALKLSAGMSGDYLTAIRCGSQIVRVGTAVMGPRPIA